MNRLFSLVLISIFALVICVRTSSKPPSDEETLKNLETEGAKHSGFSDADITFWKDVSGTRVIYISPTGHIDDQTPAEFEKMMIGTRTSNPDAKGSTEIHDIKVSISGDTAIVTSRQISTLSGLKDPNANISAGHYVAIDTWQKQSGKWKFLGGSLVSTEPIPSAAYKTPAPGASN